MSNGFDYAPMKDRNKIELGTLQIFAAVADAETLTQASGQLGITQSAVSQAIKQLEKQLATELVVRHSRPVRLTPSGQILKTHAQRILGDTRRMFVDLSMASRGGLPQLNIGMIDSFGDVAGLQLLQKIDSYTSRLALRTGLAAPLTKALLDRDLDILITSDPIEDHPELERHPVLRDPFVMIVPEKYYRNGKATPEWLSENVPFIHYNMSTRIGKLTDLIARRMNIQLMTQYELDSTQTLMRFVQSGCGWAIISGLCMVRYPELLHGVKVMQLANGANARYLTLVCHSNELGELPLRTSVICRNIYADELVPQLLEIAPWLERYAYPITEMPAI